ncbi:uncharacterized protein LOC143892909 isoform X2 [Tasmannia lanceolata]|uniref:uncharacterized protein LOC143892909 isoform X2 n=1 Tax=Tasmannia lanceolata TaxID=3420 RepID=UPI00406305E3
MGWQREEPLKERSVSSSFSDALLFTTMCIIGLPVEVQVKDGSIYSGVFHTACVENDYGIVLKKARMTKKGKNNSNLTSGALVDTLVVISQDLVQIVVKGVLLPANGVVSNVDGDKEESVPESVWPQSCQGDLERDLQVLKSGKVASKRFASEDPPQIGEIERFIQHEENNSAYTTSYEDCYHAESERGLGTRTTKPLEISLEVENGKLDSACMAKIEEASLVPVVMVDERQAGKDRPQGEDDAHDVHKENTIEDVPSSSSSTIACLPEQKSVDGMAVKISSDMLADAHLSPAFPLVAPEAQDPEPTSTDFPSSDFLTPNVSTSTSSVDINLPSCPSPLSSPNGMVPSKTSVCNANTKEFKLNPRAKTFSPSFTNPIPALPAFSTIPSAGYVPNSSPVVPIASAQAGIEMSPFAHRSPLPVKFVQYNNMVVGNNGSSSQYSLPIVGHMSSRQQQVRYGGQYQAGQAYVHPNHPNSQAVMVGRLGQLVYVHPISHDVQGSATLSHGPARPPLASHQVHLPKHQAQALQLCTTPPFMAGGQQPIAVAPFSQPFTAIRPLVVPGVNSVFGSKFP